MVLSFSTVARSAHSNNLADHHTSGWDPTDIPPKHLLSHLNYERKKKRRKKRRRRGNSDEKKKEEEKAIRSTDLDPPLPHPSCHHYLWQGRKCWWWQCCWWWWWKSPGHRWRKSGWQRNHRQQGEHFHWHRIQGKNIHHTLHTLRILRILRIRHNHHSHSRPPPLLPPLGHYFLQLFQLEWWKMTEGGGEEPFLEDLFLEDPCQGGPFLEDQFQVEGAGQQILLAMEWKFPFQAEGEGGHSVVLASKCWLQSYYHSGK